MKLLKKTALTVSAAMALTGAGLGLIGPADAAAVPVDSSITGDPNASNGTVAFYDAAGLQVTSGNDLTHLFDYALASTDSTRAATKATLFFGFPDHTNPDSTTWFESQQSASTAYPKATAPGTLATATHPLVSLTSGDGNLQGLLSTTAQDSTPGFQDILQVRVYDTGPGVPKTAPFWATDISYDSVAGTWQQEYPTVAPTTVATTTALTAAPASSATQGQSVALTATITATDVSAPAGTVQFKDGAASIGTPVTVTPGAGQSTAGTTWSSTTTGAHALHAVFIPTSAAYDGSTGDLGYTINAATPTYKPTLFGTVRVGSTVSCVASFDYATSVAYSWLVDGNPVSGATASTYKIADGYYNHLLSCRVVATNGSGGPTTTGTSSAVKVAVGPALVPTTKPALSNRNSTHLATHGTYEYVSNGAWSPAATSYTYQWYVGSTPIPHATSSRYLIANGYKGKTINCVVTAHRASWTNGAYRTPSVTVH